MGNDLFVLRFSQHDNIFASHSISSHFPLYLSSRLLGDFWRKMIHLHTAQKYLMPDISLCKAMHNSRPIICRLFSLQGALFRTSQACGDSKSLACTKPVHQMSTLALSIQSLLWTLRTLNCLACLPETFKSLDRRHHQSIHQILLSSASCLCLNATVFQTCYAENYTARTTYFLCLVR